MCLLYALSAWGGYISIDNVGPLNKILSFGNSLTSIGGGAYWAGQAVVRPLFATNGQAMMSALPLFALLKF